MAKQVKSKPKPKPKIQTLDDGGEPPKPPKNPK